MEHRKYIIKNYFVVESTTSKNKGLMRSTKGKTYEEIYGSKKAVELKAIRKKNAIYQMKVQRKDKTHIEIYGEKKAKEIAKNQSIVTGGENNPNYQGGKIILNCQKCNKEFEVCKALKNIRKHCSQECYNKFMETKIEYKCIVCSIRFSRKPSCGESKYCSWKCYHNTVAQEGNPNWKGGVSFEPYSTDWTKELRLYIRTRDNFTCQLCNMTEIESLIQMGRILTVHHIDYNKQNCDKSNLITTCAKCNSKANSNRDYWIKYFNSKLLELV